MPIIFENTWFVNISCSILAVLIIWALGVVVYPAIQKRIEVRVPLRVSGVYRCEYIVPWYYEEAQKVKEILVVVSFGRWYYGFLINSEDHDPVYRRVSRPVLRTRGEVFDERYLIGWWCHPYDDMRQHGSYMLRLDGSGLAHKGIWSGFSNTNGRVMDAPWVWRAAVDLKYTRADLVVDLMFRKVPCPSKLVL